MDGSGFSQSGVSWDLAFYGVLAQSEDDPEERPGEHVGSLSDLRGDGGSGMAGVEATRWLWSSLDCVGTMDVSPVGWAVTGIALWIVTTPLRNVAWVLVSGLREEVATAWFFWYTCGDRYLEAARSSQARSLPPSRFAWAMTMLAFLVPIAVLRDYEDRFGMFGKVCGKWWEAFHHTYCVFAPDALNYVGVAVYRYGRGLYDAVAATLGRAGDLVYGLYLCAGLLLSAVVYLPRALYDTIEGALYGWAGVATTLLVVNVYWNFSLGAVYFGGTVMFVAGYSHLMRVFDTSRRLEELAPTRVAGRGWTDLWARIGVREEQERISVERLKGGVPLKMHATKSGAPSVPCPGEARIPSKEEDVAGDGPGSGVSDKEDRRGRRGTVGEDCHGPPPFDGLAILADCLSKMCAVELRRQASLAGTPQAENE